LLLLTHAILSNEKCYVFVCAVHNDREEVINHSRKSDGGLVPMERDDWPGPPEPAAAYPELCKCPELN